MVRERRSPDRFDVTKLEQILGDIHERLSGVVIERLPYAEVIRRYDGPETLFYLDPPYWDCERDYGDGVFELADFERLAKQLSGIAGRFILSLNATPGAREVSGRFTCEEVGVTYTIGTATASRKRAEADRDGWLWLNVRSWVDSGQAASGRVGGNSRHCAALPPS